MGQDSLLFAQLYHELKFPQKKTKDKKEKRGGGEEERDDEEEKEKPNKYEATENGLGIRKSLKHTLSWKLDSLTLVEV